MLLKADCTLSVGPGFAGFCCAGPIEWGGQEVGDGDTCSFR